MKRCLTLGCFITASLLIATANAAAQSWGRPRVPSAGVCFYEDIDFGGRYFCAQAGASMEHVAGGADDEISSLRVFGDAEVTVFRDSSFRGSSRRFDADVSDLRSMGWNDRITSYRVERRGYSHGGNWGGAYGGGSSGGSSWGGSDATLWGRPVVPSTGACFYEDINFRGRYFCARLGEINARVPSGTNDEISSIRIFGNAEVTVYRDSSFQGSSRRFDANVGDLRSSGWNDRITSFRVGSRGSSHGWNSGGAYGGGGFGSSAGGGNLDLFGDINFRGRRQTLTGNTPDVRAVGMGGAISSLRLPSGGAWQVCTEPNYRGRCQVVSRDVSDLRQGDWNDAIASARRLR